MAPVVVELIGVSLCLMGVTPGIAAPTEGDRTHRLPGVEDLYEEASGKLQNFKSQAEDMMEAVASRNESKEALASKKAKCERRLEETEAQLKELINQNAARDRMILMSIADNKQVIARLNRSIAWHLSAYNKLEKFKERLKVVKRFLSESYAYTDLSNADVLKNFVGHSAAPARPGNAEEFLKALTDIDNSHSTIPMAASFLQAMPGCKECLDSELPLLADRRGHYDEIFLRMKQTLFDIHAAEQEAEKQLKEECDKRMALLNSSRVTLLNDGQVLDRKNATVTDAGTALRSAEARVANASALLAQRGEALRTFMVNSRDGISNFLTHVTDNAKDDANRLVDGSLAASSGVSANSLQDVGDVSVSPEEKTATEASLLDPSTWFSR